MSDDAPCAGFSLSKGRRSGICSSTAWCLSCRLGAGGRNLTPEAARSLSDGVFSTAELHFLEKHADSYGWYASTDDTRDLIQALCARGLMAANGDFKVRGRRSGPFLGRDRKQRPGENPRYYELIGQGCLAFHALHGDACDTLRPEPELAELPA